MAYFIMATKLAINPIAIARTRVNVTGGDKSVPRPAVRPGRASSAVTVNITRTRRTTDSIPTTAEYLIFMTHLTFLFLSENFSARRFSLIKRALFI